jgi:hypothetical protein
MSDVRPITIDDLPMGGCRKDPFGFLAAINWDVVDENADEIAAIFDKQPYKHTHVSVHDGSPAMMLSQTKFELTLVNEDGYTWVSAPHQWIRIGDETNDDYARWEKQS